MSDSLYIGSRDSGLWRLDDLSDPSSAIQLGGYHSDMGNVGSIAVHKSGTLYISALNGIWRVNDLNNPSNATRMGELPRQLRNPKGSFFHGDNLYVADTHGDELWLIRNVTTVATVTDSDGRVSVDAVAVRTLPTAHRNVASMSAGVGDYTKAPNYAYIAGGGLSRILALPITDVPNPLTEVDTTFLGNWPTGSQRLGDPTGIATTTDGSSLYITDNIGDSLWRLDGVNSGSVRPNTAVNVGRLPGGLGLPFALAFYPNPGPIEISLSTEEPEVTIEPEVIPILELDISAGEPSLSIQAEQEPIIEFDISAGSPVIDLTAESLESPSDAVFTMQMADPIIPTQPTEYEATGRYIWVSTRDYPGGTNIGDPVQDNWSLPVRVGIPSVKGDSAALLTPKPEPPVLNAVAQGRYIYLTWTRQVNLINLKHTDIQVAEQSSGPWYEPDISGSGLLYRFDIENESAEVAGHSLLHLAIPLTGDPSDPNERQLFYRARRVTEGDRRSGWSNVVDATAAAIDITEITGLIEAAKIDPNVFDVLGAFGDAMLAHWSLDDTITNLTPQEVGQFKDHSGNGIPLFVSSNTVGALPGVISKKSRSLSFSGVSSSVARTQSGLRNQYGETLTPETTLPWEHFSISLWVRFLATQPNDIINPFGYYFDGGAEDTYITLSFNAVDHTLTATVKKQINQRSEYPLSIYTAKGSANVFFDHWHHVVFHYNAPEHNCSVWIDGVTHIDKAPLINTAGNEIDTDSIQKRGRLSIGAADIDGPTNGVNGRIDEVRLYTEPLELHHVRYLWFYPEGPSSPIVDTSRIPNDLIESKMIRAGAVQANNIAANAIYADNIAAGQVKAVHVESGTLRTLIANILNYLTVGAQDGAAGFIAGERSGALRTFMDRDEFSVQRYASGAWRTQAELIQDTIDARLNFYKLSSAGTKLGESYLDGEELRLQTRSSPQEGDARVVCRAFPEPPAGSLSIATGVSRYGTEFRVDRYRAGLWSPAVAILSNSEGGLVTVFNQNGRKTIELGRNRISWYEDTSTNAKSAQIALDNVGENAAKFLAMDSLPTRSRGNYTYWNRSSNSNYTYNQAYDAMKVALRHVGSHVNITGGGTSDNPSVNHVVYSIARMRSTGVIELQTFDVGAYRRNRNILIADGSNSKFQSSMAMGF